MDINKFNPLKARYRATFAAGSTEEPRMGNVDREARVLHDVQITLEGEAKGHNVWLDRQFCEDVAAAGNKMGDAGVKVRFGHPAMCSDALGTYLGRATNFRVAEFKRKCACADGTEQVVDCAGVIADIALDEHADRTEWVLNMAESAPGTFGQSIVFTYGDWKVKDKEGKDHCYKLECVDGVEDPDSKTGKKKVITPKEWVAQSADGKRYAVMGKLLGTDFTDTPAATDGVFATGTLAEEAEQMLDEHPQVLEVLESNPDSVYQFLSRIGLLDKLESRRVSGIQAEKDREIGELKKIVGERDALLASVTSKGEAEIVALKAELAEVKQNFENAEKALAESNQIREQLTQQVEAGAKALAEVREQFERLSTKHAGIVGGALNAVNSEKKSFASFPAAVDELGYAEAIRQYPELAASYRRG